MALDLYAGPFHEIIRHQDEYLFELASKDPAKYPELCMVYNAFYSDPVLSDQCAGRLVHELIELLDADRQNKLLVLTVIRLLPFFSRAHRGKHEIRSASD